MALLELRDVVKKYDEFRVIDGLDFKVHRGELRCLLGPNGAGKTTAMDLVTGRQKVTSGMIVFDSHVVTRWAEHDRARAGIGRKFQIPAVFRDLTVRDNLCVAHSKTTNPFANIVRSRDRDAKSRLDEVVDLVGLTHRLDERAGFLSHGETQWLEIGMVLMQDPALLLLDEPTAGMTEQETHKTGEILLKLKGTRTILVVEHDMAFVRQIAEAVTVMHLGKVLAEGSLAEIERNEAVRKVYLGQEGAVHA